jgi:hypothetical protein
MKNVVLRTESKADLAKLLADLSRDIEPRDSIERTYVEDGAYHVLEIMRYRRIKTGILNNALKTALVQILRQIQFPPSTGLSYKYWLAPERLAYDWLFDQEGKRRVMSLLQEAGFDESAIEAAAYRLVADDLEKAGRMLDNAQERRDKALRAIAKYRKSFADQLRRSCDRVLAADETPRIANDEEI